MRLYQAVLLPVKISMETWKGAWLLNRVMAKKSSPSAPVLPHIPGAAQDPLSLHAVCHGIALL